MMEDLTLIEWLMLALGYATNLLTQLAAAHRRDNGPANPIRYIRKHPYNTALGLTGALAGFLALASVGQLNAVVAFACGYMGQDAIGKITAAAGNRFSKVA